MSEKRDGRKLRQAMSWAFVIVLSIVSVGAGFSIAAKANQDFGPIKTETRVTLTGKPGSELVLTPIGVASAKTHKAPVKLSVEVVDLDIKKLIRWAEQPIDTKELTDQVQEELKAGIVEAVLYGIFASTLIAFSVALLILRSSKYALVSAVSAFCLSVSLVAAAGLTYDSRAFGNATFTGSIEQGKEVLGILQGRLYNIENSRKEVRQTVKVLANLYSKPQTFPGEKLESTDRILAVSDIHLDPIGFELITSLAKEFKVDAVLDVGDINSYGTSIEADAMGKMFSPYRPYYFVAGNHDSPTIVRAVKAQKDVKVLEHSLVRESGISVYGIEDPSSKLYNMNPRDKDAEVVGESAVAEFLRVSSQEGTPSILAVHSPAMAKPFIGVADVIVCGHTHTEKVFFENGTWVINPGTTGGIKASDSKDYPHVPHTAAVLYFSREVPRKLVAVDMISVSGLYDETSITRKLIDSE